MPAIKLWTPDVGIINRFAVYYLIYYIIHTTQYSKGLYYSYILLISYSSAYHLYDDVFQPSKYRAIANHQGEVRVVFSGTIQTICLLDVTYLPFDEQICHIELDSWSLPMSQVRFSDESSLTLTNLRENGIWSITDTWKVFSHDYYRGVWFRTISFTFRWVL